MKITLCSVDSKYIHRSLSVYYLARTINEYSKSNHTAEIIEWTINSSPGELLEKILDTKPDLLGVSCYIWNIEYVLSFTKKIKLAHPGIKIVLGGPEVSFRAAEIMESDKQIDFIISGEGERAFALLTENINKLPGSFEIPGLTWRDGNKIITASPEIHTADPPSPYAEGAYGAPQIPRTPGGLVYIEASRGCPFSCAFCLSGTDESVRFFDLERVKNDIIKAASGGAGTVKFIDRTFNCNPRRAFEIFEFIIKNHGIKIPTGVSFHFEIGADLFDETTLELLKSAPAGLLRFEAGIQSYNPEALKRVNRKADPEKLDENLTRLRELGNIHLHVDLIAGLPGEDYFEFAKSFDRAFALKPHVLQLGFLKLLHGSVLRRRARELNIDFSQSPPYEIKSGKNISENDLRRLRLIESALDKIYNSGRFHHTLSYILNKTGVSPFHFFENISIYLKKESGQIPISLDKYAENLYDYIVQLPGISREAIRNLMVLDRLSTDNTGFIPSFLRVSDSRHKQARRLAKEAAGTGIPVGAAILYGIRSSAVYADYSVKNPVTGRYKILILRKFTPDEFQGNHPE